MRSAILASLIILVAAVTTAAATPYGRRHYIDHPDSTFNIASATEPLQSIAIEVRAALTQARETRRHQNQWWGIRWGFDGECVIIHPHNTDLGSITDRRVVTITHGRYEPSTGQITPLSSADLASGVNAAAGAYNTLLLEWADSTLSVYVGARTLTPVMTIAHSAHPTIERLIHSGPIDMASHVVETVADPVAALATTAHTLESLSERLDSTLDPLEGTWHYLDRQTDSDRTHLGGSYTMAIVRSGRTYEILYLDGAQVNADKWQPLMLKGRLSPTQFESHYDLIWHDAMMQPIATETYATLSEQGILTLQFPLLHTTLRFYRATRQEND